MGTWMHWKCSEQNGFEETQKHLQKNKHITYISVEHVVCSPESDIVEQDLCYCIHSLKNQIYFLPFSTEENTSVKNCQNA